MTEICVQIKGNLQEVKKSALEKGFQFVESYNNHDTYYTNISKDDLKKVNYKKLIDSSMIVRHITSENWEVKKLVYKKKTLDNSGNVIEEIKTNVNVDDTNKLNTIFTNMGLTCWCDFVNENNEFKKGEIVLNIQYVKELGVFAEIEEFDSIKNKSDKEKFNILIDIINSLGFDIGDDYSCKKPYIYLYR